MKTVLERLVTTAGIAAAAAFDADGNLLCASGAMDFANLGRTLSFLAALCTTSPVSSVVGPLRAAVLRTTRGTLVLRSTGQVMLLLIGAPDLDVGRGGIGFHVSVAFKVLTIRARTQRPAPPQSMVVPSTSAAAVEGIASAKR
jgi:predicted regulator of Ras-like GTPase activity (Roadblock/LC7/MglB family)